jgi:hypothetical protein
MQVRLEEQRRKQERMQRAQQAKEEQQQQQQQQQEQQQQEQQEQEKVARAGSGSSQVAPVSAAAGSWAMPAAQFRRQSQEQADSSAVTSLVSRAPAGKLCQLLHEGHAPVGGQQTCVAAPWQEQGVCEHA